MVQWVLDDWGCWDDRSHIVGVIEGQWYGYSFCVVHPRELNTTYLLSWSSVTADSAGGYGTQILGFSEDRIRNLLAQACRIYRQTHLIQRARPHGKRWLSGANIRDGQQVVHTTAR